MVSVSDGPSLSPGPRTYMKLLPFSILFVTECETCQDLSLGDERHKQ